MNEGYEANSDQNVNQNGKYNTNWESIKLLEKTVYMTNVLTINKLITQLLTKFYDLRDKFL